MQAALYSLTKQLMDDMNVQLQYQMQHNLSGWLSSAAPGAAGLAPAGYWQLSGGERSSRHNFRRRRFSAPGAAQGGPAPAPAPAPGYGAAAPSPAQPPGYPEPEETVPPADSCHPSPGPLLPHAATSR